MVTTAPSIAIRSSSFGMATISLDFSATLTCPSTRRWRTAKAETMWMGALPLVFWPERREVLPSMAITSAGTVNLIGSGRDKAHEGRSHEGVCPSGHAGDLGPDLEGLGPGGSVLGGGAVIAAEVEQVVDLIVSGEEALSLAG